MPLKPKSWAECTEGEKSAIRAQAYPDIIDDQGREWKIGKIDNLQALNAELLTALKGLLVRFDFGDYLPSDHPIIAARAVIAKCEGR